MGFFISSQNWCCTSKQMWLFIFLELFCNAVCCQRKVIICSISEAVAVVFLWYLTTEKKVNMLYHAPLPRIQSNLTTPTSKPVFLWLLHYTGDERSKKCPPHKMTKSRIYIYTLITSNYNQQLLWLSLELQMMPGLSPILHIYVGFYKSSVMCLQWKKIKRFLPNSTTVITWLVFPKSHVNNRRWRQSLASSGVLNSITAVVGEVIVTYLTSSN